MRAEALLDAIGDVRNVYIQQAQLRKKKHRQLPWIAAAAACLALVLTAGLLLRPSSNKYPPIPWPQAGGQTSLSAEFSLDPALTLPDTAEPIAVYQPVIPNLDALCAELAAFHGLDNQWKENDLHRYIATDTCLLEVEKDTGYWTYQDRTVIKFSNEPSILTDDEAIQIAKATAEHYGVDLAFLSNVQVGHGTISSADTPIGQEAIVGHDVYFYPSIDGYDVWGICRFMVSVNGTGQVSTVMKLYPEFALHAMEQAVSPADAFRAIQAGAGHFMDTTDATSVVFHSYDIIYYADFDPATQQQYCQPLYVFYGDDCRVLYPVLGEQRFRG